MKTFQRLCVIVMMTLALTLPTLAGDIDTGAGVAPPPPPPTSSLIQGDVETLSGQMPTGPGATTTGGESYVGAVWELLEGVLALF